MANETIPGKYGRLVDRDGKPMLVVAPSNMPEHIGRRLGYLPVQYAERDPAKRAIGRGPVQRDGYIEVVWIYKED